MYLFGLKSKICYLWWHTPTCRSNLIYMRAAKCRGHKSLNRIELSWFIQELFHFYWFAVPTVPMFSPYCLSHPHIVSIIPTSSPSSPHHPHTPIYLPPTPSTLCLHVVSVVPTSSLLFPCHPHIIFMVPMSSPHPHIPTPPPTHTPTGGPRISKNSIRFELIKTFQFFLKIWNLWRLPNLRLGVWVFGWMGGVMSNH